MGNLVELSPKGGPPRPNGVSLWVTEGEKPTAEIQEVGWGARGVQKTYSSKLMAFFKAGLFFNVLNIYLFVCLWLRWVLFAACGILHCSSWAPGHRLSSCVEGAGVGSWLPVAGTNLSFPDQGLNPSPVALEGGFLTRCTTREVPPRTILGFRYLIFTVCTVSCRYLEI